jgi:hypothetical protein
MSKKRRKLLAILRRGRRGQGMVEMALLTPLLALILVGTIDLGRVYIDMTRLNNAVKEAAVTGLYQPNFLAVKKRAYLEVYDPASDRDLLGTPDVQFVVYSFNRYAAADPTAAIDCRGNPVNLTIAACANPGPGDVVEVKGVYYFQPITSMILRIFPTNLPVYRTVKAVY